MLHGAVVLFVTFSALPVAVHARVAGDTTAHATVQKVSLRDGPGSAAVGARADRFRPVAVAGLGGAPAAGARVAELAVPADTPVVPGARTAAPADTPVVRADTPVARPRPRAIEYSDAYNTRLTIHRIGSFVILPMFAAEYWMGQKLISQTTPAATWVKPTHRAVAYAVTGVFALNTVTGVWNLWDSRKDPNGRTRRWVHTLTMLAADGGFVAADASAHHAAFAYSREVRHRNIALASIGLSTASALYMWLTR